MPPKAAKGVKKGVKGKGGKRKGAIEEEDMSQHVEDDADLLNMDQNNQQGIEQEQLTTEEKDASIFKTLSSNNPLAPHNLTKYSFKDRIFKTEDSVDHLVFHV
jgi:ABC-type uncharacterized transport system ATPase subunit